MRIKGIAAFLLNEAGSAALAAPQLLMRARLKPYFQCRVNGVGVYSRAIRGSKGCRFKGMRRKE